MTLKQIFGTLSFTPLILKQEGSFISGRTVITVTQFTILYVDPNLKAKTCCCLSFTVSEDVSHVSDVFSNYKLGLTHLDFIITFKLTLNDILILIWS